MCYALTESRVLGGGGEKISFYEHLSKIGMTKNPTIILIWQNSSSFIPSMRFAIYFYHVITTPQSPEATQV